MRRTLTHPPTPLGRSLTRPAGNPLTENPQLCRVTVLSVLPNCLEVDGVTVGGRGTRPKDTDKPTAETDGARAKSAGKTRPGAGPALPTRQPAFRPVVAPRREATHAAGRYSDRSKNRRIAVDEAAATAADRRRQVRVCACVCARACVYV